MNPKRIFIVSTMALSITIGVGGLSTKESNAQAVASTAKSNIETVDTGTLVQAVSDEFLTALGVSSEEEVHDALLDGKSLAAVAQDNGGDAEALVELQIAQLTEQLDLRLASGSLKPDEYEAQKAEVADIIRHSVYGQKPA